jgi:hypothetical protein
MRAGFSETDITPKPGLLKIGWLQEIKGDVILDPLWARAAVFESGEGKVGFIQLDHLSVRWTLVSRIREEIKKRFSFPAENIMVAATHNHAGPDQRGTESFLVKPTPDQMEYIGSVVERCAECFGKAIAGTREVTVGFNSVFNFEVGHNRRTIMRDGFVKSQTSAAANKNFLCLEGPRDAEVAVLAAKDSDGKVIGVLVNYACHPTHHGGTNEISAGYPGVLAAELKKAGVPSSVFLNGAYGNIIHADFETGKHLSKEESGASLSKSVMSALEGMEYKDNLKINSGKVTAELPFRKFTDDEAKGRIPGAQRFRSDEYYNAMTDLLKKRIAEQKVKLAELQTIRIGDVSFSGVPAEYFVEHQLELKKSLHPFHALTVGGANGMMGYVPTKDAFTRGGYETTLMLGSRMAPETGEMILGKNIETVKKLL